MKKDFFWDKNLDTLTPVLKALGVEYKVVSCEAIRKNNARFPKRYFDCLHPSLNDPELQFPYSEDECVIAYGSIEFIGLLDNRDWLPCHWNNYDNLKCSMYYSYYGKYMFNQDYTFLTLAEIERKKEFVFEQFRSINSVLDEINKKDVGREMEIFIRPDSSKKEFSGCVASLSNFRRDVEHMSYGTLEPYWMCLVSDVKPIKDEYRFVVADKKVIAGTTYKVDGEYDEKAEYPQEAFYLAQRIAFEKWQPCKVYSLDICSAPDIKGHIGYSLLEVNGFNTAGMYLCDWNKIVPALNEIALKEWGEVWGEPEIIEAK